MTGLEHQGQNRRMSSCPASEMKRSKFNVQHTIHCHFCDSQGNRRCTKIRNTLDSHVNPQLVDFSSFRQHQGERRCLANVQNEQAAALDGHALGVIESIDLLKVTSRD